MMSASADNAGRGRRRLSGTFRALSHRNYRLLWVGALLSSAGTWMQGVAQGWLVLQLTDSPFWLGADGFMASLPGLLFTLHGGVLADMLDRRRLLIATQLVAGLSALALGVLVATGVVADAGDVWVVLVLSFVTGCSLAFALPAYQTIIVDLVGREDLGNAIALNAMQFHFSRVVGPLLAGLGIQWLGVAGCFFANALSYVAILWALALVRFGSADRSAQADATSAEAEAAGGGVSDAGRAGGAPAARALRDRRALWGDLTDGFRYAWGRPRVRLLLVCSAVVSLFGAPYLVLMPYVARDVLHWGERGLSLLMGAAGAGAFCGSLLVAFLGDFRRRGRFILLSALSAAGCLVAFSLTARPAAALALLFAVGFAMVCFFAVSNTLLQHLVRDEMRGRVMSMWVLTFLGTMPVGSFLAGAVAERFGSAWALGGGGLLIAAYVLIFGLPNAGMREI